MKAIPLGGVYYCLVDDADFEWLAGYRWRKGGDEKRPYAVTSINRRTVRMHRLLCVGDEIDHIDGDSLNNQRSNLRSCTHAQNMHNKRKTTKPCSSKYKGVHKASSSARPWFAKIKFNAKTIYIGTYATEIEAAQAYDQRAQELFGEFARRNLEGA